MLAPTKDSVILLLQSIDEEKYKETVHMLEQESGLFFNIRYFKELWLNGDWDKVEKYLSAFTKICDNMHSTRIFHEIRKLKYLEALYSNNDAKAVEILKDLREYPDLYKVTTQLLTLNDFRQHEQLSHYRHPEDARTKVFNEIEWVIQGNPRLHDKLNIPRMNPALWTRVNQSVNWEFQFPENPNPIADTEIPLVNPSGTQLPPIGVQTISSVANPLMGAVPIPGDFPSLGFGGNNIIQSSADEEVRIADNSIDNSKTWKLSKITEPSQCRSLILPDNFEAARVSRLSYTKSRDSILALAANALNKLWKWPRGKATASVVPHLWQPSSGTSMTNDISGTRPQDAIPCLALSHNGDYVLSASGGAISLYELTTFARIAKFAPPPSTPTYIACNPEDNDVIVVGMKDSSIVLINVLTKQAVSFVKGNQERITGLAFSCALKVIVWSGADARLIRPRDRAPLITHATYSCDSPSIYVGYDDGSVIILTASISAAAQAQARCIISPTSYLPANPSSRVYPLVIAAHPSEPNQFALGLSDGGVCVLEPLESEGKWGTDPPPQDGAGT